MNSTQAIDAVILGSAGYGGGELLRLLHAHPHVASVRAISGSHAGQPWHLAHPRLRGFIDGVFEDEVDWAALAASRHPVLFSAQPNGVLAESWPAMEAALAEHGLSERLTVIDLSGDFRLRDASVHEAAYAHAHPVPEQLGEWVYGLSEHHGEGLTGARRIANPGCFATAVQLALRPLLSVTQPDWIAATGVTGSSGSGVHPSTTTHHPDRAQDFRAYRAFRHQHAPEILQGLSDVGGGQVALGFVPHSGPFVRGIFVSLQTRVSTAEAASLPDVFARYCAEHPFLRLVEGSPRIQHLVGTNACDISVTVDGGQVVVMAALDNLIKGMSGQAVQNMNIALGYEETAGLNAC